MHIFRSITFLLVCLLSCLAAQAQQSFEIPDDVKFVRSVFVPMRDGVRLSTDLYFPVDATGKLPVVLLRTPYSKEGAWPWSSEIGRLVGAGYVVAFQDIRGRFESEGRYRPAQNGREDGYDTIDWLSRQDWADGKVATFGCSYLGETQLYTAAARHPNHLAALPMSPASGVNLGGRPWTSFDGGALELAQTAGWFLFAGSNVFYGPPEWIDREAWFQSEQSRLFNTGYEAPRNGATSKELLEIYSTLPVTDIVKNTGLHMTDYEEFVTSTPESAYFDAGEWIRSDDAFDVPALYLDSWYDYGAGETLKLFNQMRENGVSRRSRDNQYIIVAPSVHCNWDAATENTVIGERDLGDARMEFLDLYIRWLDHWLKDVDNGIGDMPPVQYYLMGANEWKTANEWPVAGTEYREFFLAGGGDANSRFGDGRLVSSVPESAAADAYVYDPASPVPTYGGNVCCTGMETGAGGYDQSAVETRNDVLVYTSAPLEEGIEVTGFLKAVLYVSSDAKDTDFTVKLVDVYPDGRAFNIQEGARRMRYRESLREPVWMQEGEVYEIEIDLHATSNFFGVGHRIRVEVSSSNFPRWSRNLNTGGNNFDETKGIPARNSVHHSQEYPSHLLLPVVGN